MGKKVLTAIITLAMLSAFIPCVYAADIIASGDCGADGSNVTWTLDADGVLTISGEGEMKDYIEINENGNPVEMERSWDKDAVKKVVVENGVTKIGAYAFGDCDRCAEAVIGDTVTYIGERSFSCIDLASVNIPDGVTYIGETAFWGTSIESLTLPDSITYLGGGAFYCCLDLKSINIPKGVKSINGDTFSYCYALENIDIHKNIEEIAINAFGECTSLKSINVDADNQYYCSVDGVLFNKEQTELLRYPSAKADKSYIVPNGIEYIGEDAFEYTLLEEITLPESLKSIGEWAFCPAENLKSIRIPSNVESIAENTFILCGALSEITVDENNEYYSASDNILFNKDKTKLVRYSPCKTDTAYSIPSSVKEIASRAFDGNKNITRVSIPHGVTMVDRYTFRDCTSLAEVYIPNTVTKIGAWAFENCDAVTDIYYYGTQEKWSSVDFWGKTHLTNAEVHFVPTRISETTAFKTENGERTLNAVFENVPVFSKLITVFYSNGVVTGIKTTDINAGMINSGSQKIPVTNEQTDSAKVFIWNGINDMRPLCASKEL